MAENGALPVPPPPEEADASTAHASKKAKTAAASAPPLERSLSAEATHAMRKAWRQVCLLEVVSVEWRYLAPWSRMSQKQSSGSGFCISGRRILTNAHVVKSATDIRVRQHGSAQRLRAHVVAYGPDVDLAILELDGEDAAATDAFFSDAELSLADGLPALQEVVRAIGFPTGGKTICVTEGVVSRIDTIAGTPPADSLLAIQIDAAINPGNSGGPVFDAHGRVAGVAFCKDSRNLTDNIGYVIPAEVVRAFLERCDAAAPSREPRAAYAFSPSVPYRYHKLENKSLRAAHGVPDHVNGILLTSVAPAASAALAEGDVLTRIDGRRIADDGQARARESESANPRARARTRSESGPLSRSSVR